MKLWSLSTLLTASLLLFSGCVGSSPKPKDESSVDETLPLVHLTKSGVILGMKEIAFEWERIKDPRVEGVYIYKSKLLDDNSQSKLEFYTTIDNRFSTHYLDRNIEPNTQYKYAFKTFSHNADGRLSKVLNVKSLPVLHSVSWIYSVTGMPRVAKILWRPHSNQKVTSYIIERQVLNNGEWDEVAQIKGRLSAEYIDTELEDNHIYKYRIRVKTFDNIISSPSSVVKVVTKALPQGVKSIHATTNLAKEIKIEWSKTNSKDFSLYYLYRAEDIDGDYKLIATLHNPVFRDKIDEDGKVYFYRVSIVDKDGLESKNNKVFATGKTLIKPDTPTITKAKLIDNKKVELQWVSNDPRVQTYTITKTEKQGWFEKTSQNIENIPSNQYIDTDIKPGTKYTYVLYGVDQYGIKSKPTLDIEIQTKESEEVIEQVQEKQNKVQSKSTNETIAKKQKDELVSPVEDLDINGL
jgi:fibronectin type 3 domain-containing protein